MFPENTAEDVETVLKHVKIVDAEKQFVFEENLPEKKGTKYPFVTPCSIFQAIKLFVDLRGSVSKKTLKNFAVYCQDPKEKERMLEVANSKDLLLSEITNKSLGLIHVLTTVYSSC